MQTTTETTQRIVLASRPVGAPTLENFRLEELPIGQPGPGQMLLRTLWLSLDPYMRGRMSDAPSYAKPVGIGDVMEGGTVSEVLTSNVPRFAKGDIVVGRTGWQTYALSDGSGLQKVDPGRAPISAALGVLGMPGMTAYVGLLEIGKPAVGETVVVAAASGAVGSVGFVERLVWFWSNYFCVSADKIPAMAGPYEREAIRPHILGRFADMLQAVEGHPAMLFYLDNVQSTGPNSTAGINRDKGLAKRARRIRTPSCAILNADAYNSTKFGRLSTPSKRTSRAPSLPRQTLATFGHG